MPKHPTRRDIIARAASGLGAWAAAQHALGSVAGTSANPEAAVSPRISPPSSPLAPKAPHFAPCAKQVIMIFLPGGCSHVDSFDPKPDLGVRGGREDDLPTPWMIRPRGGSGTLATDLFPQLADRVDELCLIRSMHGDHNNHTAATMGMHTGSVSAARPSLGAWVSYALGTLNPNLPSHVVLASKPPYGGSLVWDANFLPACHQGVQAVPGERPIANLTPRDVRLQSHKLEMLRELNAEFAWRRGGDSNLTARQLSFDTAAGMQRVAPEAFDLHKESKSTRRLYGMDTEPTDTFGWQCLVARRLIERGVRFVELIDVGPSNNWDAHGSISTHEPLAKRIDRPICGLLSDMRQRGLLDDTLVVWCTEFGRTPRVQPGTRNGRNHHNKAFTCWLAGGGTRAGYVHGATDPRGQKVIKDPVHTHDFHATILYALGLHHEQLTYRHSGRDFRLTDVAGNVVQKVFA